MNKKEKIILYIVLGFIVLWGIFLLLNLPSGKYCVYREVLIVVSLIFYFIYFTYTFILRWQKRIQESDSVETALAKFNYFPICTSENETIIYCNDKFLKILGYKDLVFIIGRQLKEIFHSDTYSQIKDFLYKSNGLTIKYFNGYIFNRYKSFVQANIIIQKLTINEKKYEHIEIVDSDFLGLITTYIPQNLINILNSIEDPILFIDTQNNIKWINYSGLKFFNIMSVDKIVGKKCYEVFKKKDKVCDDCVSQRITQTRGPIDVKSQFLDGRYIHIRCEPVRDEKGNQIGILKIIRDITTQREIEIKRMEMESRLSLITEQLPTLIWTVDENLKVTYLNGVVLNNLKISSQEILGKTLYELFNTTDIEYPVIKYALLALTGQSGSYHIKIMGRNYIVHYKPFIDLDGKIAGCVGVSHDITELINIQRELEEKNEILELIGGINKIISYSKTESQLIDELINLIKKKEDTINVVYFSIDTNKNSFTIAKSAKSDTLTRYLSDVKISDSESLKNPLILSYFDMDIKSINDVEKSEIDNSFRNLLLKENIKSIIFIPIITDTQIHSILCIASNKKNRFNNIRSYLNISRDVGVAISNILLQEQQRKNEEIIRKNQSLMIKIQKYEYTSRLATGLAHDFNNILFSIKSYIEIIKRGMMIDKEVENYVSQIDKAIHKGKELASYLMRYSSYESMKKENHPVRKFYECLNEKLSNLCQSKYVKFISENRCEDVLIPCDLEKVSWAIEESTRYLINQIERGSSIEFLLEPFSLKGTTSKDSPEKILKIAILSDSILPEDLLNDNLFEVKLPPIVGEGIECNLPLVNNIIRLHGGYIFSDRGDNKNGFVIILPYSDNEINQVENKITLVEQDKNILIVEDDPYVKEPLEIILKDFNCNVFTASNGAEALKLAKSINYKVQLLITDIEMPLIDGITLAEEVYKCNNLVKIIYMSGYIKDFASKEKRFVPNSIFLQKPFSIDILKNIIRDVLKI